VPSGDEAILTLLVSVSPSARLRAPGPLALASVPLRVKTCARDTRMIAGDRMTVGSAAADTAARAHRRGGAQEPVSPEASGWQN